MLVGIAAAQLAGEEFQVGLDRHRADTAGQALTPVPGLDSTTAAGLARRFVDGHWVAVETGLGDVHAAALATLAAMAPQRATALGESVTIDLDTADVEVYGRCKQGVAYAPGAPYPDPAGADGPTEWAASAQDYGPHGRHVAVATPTRPPRCGRPSRGPKPLTAGVPALPFVLAVAA